ncbi:unnamed protein product [Lupinus luteus]|uniref:RRM domain-containing protein n=1 Tax=Lupinus luteus TaxID=3873 RepID=A0AAV1YHB8_LUPLU
MKESERVRVRERENHRGGLLKKLEVVGENFFFINILESRGISEMWKVFRKWGTMGKVVIPPKRDKWRNQFGFVRFLKVDGDGCSEESLQNIWTGNYKVKINKQRFNRHRERIDVREEPKKVKLLARYGLRRNHPLAKSWKEVVIRGPKDAQVGCWMRPYLDNIEIHIRASVRGKGGYFFFNISLYEMDGVKVHNPVSRLKLKEEVQSESEENSEGRV